MMVHLSQLHREVAIVVIEIHAPVRYQLLELQQNQMRDNAKFAIMHHDVVRRRPQLHGAADIAVAQLNKIVIHAVDSLEPEQVIIYTL
jgi:hypothetical protein